MQPDDSRSHPSLVLLVLLTFLLLAVPATAQETGTATETEDADEPKITLDETVDVEGEAPAPPSLAGIERRLPMDEEETPASLSSVGQPLLADQGAVSLSDALKNVPGINVQTGSGVFDQWTLRGFDGLSSSLVLSDGSVEPESTMMHLYNVDRVEVLRGAAGFLYGGRAMAGTINLVRKRPTGGNFVELGLTGGSYGFAEGTVDANWQYSPSAGFRLNGLWRTADQFRDDNELDVVAINPSWAWKSDGTTVGVHFEYVSNEVTPDSGIPVVNGSLPEIPRDRTYSSPFDQSEQDVVRFQVNVEHELGDDLSWRTKVYYNSLDWTSSGTILSGASDLGFATLAFRALTSLEDRQDFFGVQSEVAWNVDTGPVRHEILAGVELARYEDDFRFDVFSLPPIDVFRPLETASRPLFPFPSQSRFGDVANEVVAPFVLDRIVFSDAFQLLVGARWDQIDMDASGTAAARDDEQLSPLLGVVVAPTDVVSFYANYSESFEPQSTLVVGELEPEEAEQAEAGVKLALAGGRVNADLTWFQIDKTNLAIPDQFGFPAQTGSQDSEGVELEVTAGLGDGFDLRLAYAHTDAELTEFREIVVFGPGPTDFFVADRAGNVPAFVPENLGNLWLSKHFRAGPLDGFGFGLGARWVDEQFIDEDNAFALDDYTLLDAAVFYHWERMQLHLNLFNLGDEEYATRAFGPGAVAPAPGTEARLTLRYLM